MKKFLVAVFALLICNIGLAKNLETIVAEIEKESLAVVMSMDHDMIMKKVGNNSDMYDLLKDIEKVKVYMNNGENDKTLNLFRNKVSELDTTDMETLVKVSDEEDKISIYAKKEGNEQIKDIIILVDSDDNYIMLIMTGNIKRDVVNRMLETGVIKIS